MEWQVLLGEFSTPPWRGDKSEAGKGIRRNKRFIAKRSRGVCFFQSGSHLVFTGDNISNGTLQRFFMNNHIRLFGHSV